MENIERIIDCAARLWSVSRDEVLGERRYAPLPFARAMISYVLKNDYGMTLMRIGNVLNRTHCSIIYFLKMYEAEYAYNKDFRAKADALRDIDATEFKQELEEELNYIMA